MWNPRLTKITSRRSRFTVLYLIGRIDLSPGERLQADRLSGKTTAIRGFGPRPRTCPPVADREASPPHTRKKSQVPRVLLSLCTKFSDVWLIIIVILANDNDEEENPVFIYLQYCLNSNYRSLPCMSVRNDFYLSLRRMCGSLTPSILRLLSWVYWLVSFKIR